MKELKRTDNTLRFVPHFRAKSLADIDFSVLKKRGVTHIAFDADSTLVPFRGKVIDQSIRDFLAAEKDNFKAWCIASNRVTNDLQPLADSIGATLIQATPFIRKPQRRFFQRIFDHFDAPPDKIAMIGDKLFADIWGANRAGMVTVWVQRLGKDSPWDRALQTRRLEMKLFSRSSKKKII